MGDDDGVCYLDGVVEADADYNDGEVEHVVGYGGVASRKTKIEVTRAIDERVTICALSRTETGSESEMGSETDKFVESIEIFVWLIVFQIA